MSSSPYINQFIQPDTLIPDPANPQAFNRYSYVGNNPINFNDPTGHDRDCGVGVGDRCNDLGIFALAGIYQQSWCNCGWKQETVLSILAVRLISGYPDYYTSLGAAKVSHAQMNTPRGEMVKEPGTPKGTGERGMGLGLLGRDPNNYYDAKSAMTVRISITLSKCPQIGCSKTDEIIVAAMAANGDLFPDMLEKAFKNKDYFTSEGKFDWNEYIASDVFGTEESYQRQHVLEEVIPYFVLGLPKDNVIRGPKGKGGLLIEPGYKRSHPEVDWQYIGNLAAK